MWSIATRSGRVARALAHLRVALRSVHGPQVAALDADDREVDVVLDGQPAEQPRLLVRAGQAELARGCGPAACVTSWPKSSTVPDVAGKSPAITLNSVVLPAPFGPSIARRSPVRDLEVDVADGIKTAETPADPPEQEGRRGASASSSGLVPLPRLLDDSVDDRRLLPGPRQPLVGAGGNDVRLGGSLTVPPKVSSTYCMTFCTVTTASAPGCETSMRYEHCCCERLVVLAEEELAVRRVGQTTFASTFCSAFCPPEMLPLTALRAFISAQVLA